MQSKQKSSLKEKESPKPPPKKSITAGNFKVIYREIEVPPSEFVAPPEREETLHFSKDNQPYPEKK